MPNRLIPQCITLSWPGIARVIQCPVKVSQAFDPRTAASGAPTYFETTAIWDTGATGSVITQIVVDKCGLKQIGLTQVHGVNSSDLSPVYLVNFKLPNMGFMNVRVTLGKLPDAATGVLIGMDIISKGDFAITNHEGKTVCSFQCPSNQRIDFIGNRPSNLNPYGGKNHPRNSPCYCGSGKKYKWCHGAPKPKI
jgi:Aspartyl protease/SEC-C motif